MNAALPVRDRSSPLLVLAVAALLAVHAMFAWQGIYHRSVTSDETGHLVAGFAYWKYGDFRLQPENGNLPQRWSTLPLLVGQPALDPAKDARNWIRSDVWNIAQAFLFESGNNSEFLLLCARTTMLAWSIAAGLIVFFWSRKIWGSTAAIGSLALFAFSPTTLAHAPLVTSDMCAAVCLLGAIAAWWQMCLGPSFLRAGAAGIATGLAFLAKFSAVTLLPVFAALAAIALYVEPGSHSRGRARQLFVAIGFAVAVVYALIWAFFLFRYSAANVPAIPFSRFYIPWEIVSERGGILRDVAQFARTWHIFPEAYLYGFSFVLYFSAERGAFLAGQFSTTGWWWFFPFAFFVKSTIGELVVAGLVLARGWFAARKMIGATIDRALRSPLLPLALFGVVFGAISVGSHLNIGQRHILPLYLILFIMSGALFSASCPILLRIAAGLAVLGSAVETWSNSPNHLAFFNRLVGGPQNGWHLLVDSSLDWGQDVAPLADWVRQHRKPGEPVYYSCFGTADPEYEGIRGEPLSPYYSLGKPRHWIDLKPGLYCISATMLQDVYGIRPGPWRSELERHFQQLKYSARINVPNGAWNPHLPSTGHHPENPLWLLDRLRFARLCAYLRLRRPDAVINHTQFVFRLTADEIDTFSNKPYSALALMMEKSATMER